MSAKIVTDTQILKTMPYTLLMNAGGRPAKSKRSELGLRIAKAREQKGISQYELADILGVHQQSIANWERKATAIRSDTLIKLAKALGVSSDELLGLEVPQTQYPSGKIRTTFEALNKLPRRQQQRILGMVEDMLIAQEAKAQ